MDRRNFLKNLAMATPVAAVKPTYFFAPIGGWHSELLINPFHPSPFTHRYHYYYGIDAAKALNHTVDAVWSDNGTIIYFSRREL